MATTFLEPGGDATFNVATTTAGGFWNTLLNAPTLGTDFVNVNHKKSIKYGIGNRSEAIKAACLSDSGTRISVYIYLNALPTATASIIFGFTSGLGAVTWGVRLTSAGVLQLWNGQVAQIGTNGSTLSTSIWYRLSLAYTITDTTHNRFELFKNGVSDISVTNGTLSNVVATDFAIGNANNSTGDVTLDIRSSDHYIDNSNSLTDPGTTDGLFVIAKRPNANGTANNFATQIGTGASGFGTGHAPQVNERPLSNTNGWSVVAVGATTEEYNIEPSNGLNDLMKEDGFFLLQESGSFIILDDSSNVDLTSKTIVDYMGWIDYKTVLSESASIVLNGVSTAFSSAVNAETMFTKFAGSTTYPSGTGTDIGMITDATATTVSLYECGIIVAYTPAVAASVVSPIQEYMLMGVGT
jgi:hypothetical protein